MTKIAFKHYVGTKELLGFPMNKKDYCAHRNWDVPEGEDPEEEGYLVEYFNHPPNPNHPEHRNYISWSPKKVFEDIYVLVKGHHETQNLKPVFPTKEISIEVEQSTDLDYGGAHKYHFKNCVGWVDGNTKYDGGEQTIQFVQKNEDGSIIPGLQSEQLLIALIDRHQKLNKKFPCRENSLMITKLQEALHWQEARLRDRVDRGVMGDLKK